MTRKRLHEAEAAREQKTEEQERDPEPQGVDHKQHRALGRMPLARGKGQDRREGRSHARRPVDREGDTGQRRRHHFVATAQRSQPPLGGSGDLVFKPRNQWHTFWNAGDEPCRILEIIAPAGFERFFRELSDMGGTINADADELTALGARYGHYVKLESVPELLERFGLRIGEPLSGGWTP